MKRSNNTNKLSPQELRILCLNGYISSNNTNKLSPQEQVNAPKWTVACSNNTNKLSPQEPLNICSNLSPVQIIQINLALKNIKEGFIFLLTFK